MASNYVHIVDGTVYYTYNSITMSDGTPTINDCGVWDGTASVSGWSTLDGSVQSGYSRGICYVSPTKIFLYGSFSIIGVSNQIAHGSSFSVARWDGTKWNSLGTLGHTNGTVYDVCYDSTNGLLYACGNFSSIYGQSASRIAVFNESTETWSALSSGLSSSGYSCVLDSDNNLYVGGSFTSAGGISGTKCLAKWDGSNWSSLGTVPNSVYTIQYGVDTDALYVGGLFNSVDSLPNTGLLAKYTVSTSTWSSLGDFTNGGDTVIYTLRYNNNDSVYVGGAFVSNGSGMAYRDSDGNWTDLAAGSYSFSPSLGGGSFTAIDMTVDTSGNIIVIRNVGTTHILEDGTTTWYRSDNLNTDIQFSTVIPESVEEEEEDSEDNVCFTGDALVRTDQGPFQIKHIDPEVHTLNGQPVVALVKTRLTDPYLYRFLQDALHLGVPDRETTVSGNHQLQYQGKMVRAKRLAQRLHRCNKVKNTGQTVYNVLLAFHGTMKVNNLIAETLHPKDPAALKYSY